MAPDQSAEVKSIPAYFPGRPWAWEVNPGSVASGGGVVAEQCRVAEVSPNQARTVEHVHRAESTRDRQQQVGARGAGLTREPGTIERRVRDIHSAHPDVLKGHAGCLGEGHPDIGEIRVDDVAPFRRVAPAGRQPMNAPWIVALVKSALVSDRPRRLNISPERTRRRLGAGQVDSAEVEPTQRAVASARIGADDRGLWQWEPMRPSPPPDGPAPRRAHQTNSNARDDDCGKSPLRPMPAVSNVSSPLRLGERLRGDREVKTQPFPDRRTLLPQSRP